MSVTDAPPFLTFTSVVVKEDLFIEGIHVPMCHGSSLHLLYKDGKLEFCALEQKRNAEGGGEIGGVVSTVMRVALHAGFNELFSAEISKVFSWLSRSSVSVVLMGTLGCCLRLTTTRFWRARFLSRTVTTALGDGFCILCCKIISTSSPAIALARAPLGCAPVHCALMSLSAKCLSADSVASDERLCFLRDSCCLEYFSVH